MVREKDLQSPAGQAAWLYYQQWMKMHRKHAHTASAFLHSRYFAAFLRFAKFTRKVKLPDINAFMNLMKTKDLSPTIWTSDDAYTLYIEFLDRKLPAMDHVDITVGTLFDVADSAGCDVSEAFDYLYPAEVMQLIRQRRLSPWFLLQSSKFKEYLMKHTSTEERIILEQLVRPKYWKGKFDMNPDAVEKIRSYAREMGL